MKKTLSCAQVIALMGFYIENKLTSKLKNSIASHLNNCPECRKFYFGNNIKSDDIQQSHQNNSDWVESFSAYIDNELNDNDAVKIRKISITNPVARKRLENMYLIKSEMHNYFNKIKNESKTDYSKDIISALSGEKSTNQFNRLVWTFTAMLSAILAGFIVMLYF